MPTSEDVFVHARLPDGATRLVGRYRFVRPDAGNPFGEFQYVGSWYRNEHGSAFTLDPVNLPLTDETVRATRARLFGSWEMNWIAYNVAHDVALPGSKHGGPVPYLMYPQGETANGRLDSLDPEAFSYEITVREPPQDV